MKGRRSAISRLGALDLTELCRQYKQRLERLDATRPSFGTADRPQSEMATNQPSGFVALEGPGRLYVGDQSAAILGLTSETLEASTLGPSQSVPKRTPL